MHASVVLVAVVLVAVAVAAIVAEVGSVLLVIISMGLMSISSGVEVDDVKVGVDAGSVQEEVEGCNWSWMCDCGDDEESWSALCMESLLVWWAATVSDLSVSCGCKTLSPVAAAAGAGVGVGTKSVSVLGEASSVADILGA